MLPFSSRNAVAKMAITAMIGGYGGGETREFCRAPIREPVLHSPALEALRRGAVRIGQRLEGFLGEVNPVVLGTIRSDGSVHLTPLWFEYREGFVWINGAASRDWLAHLRHDDRVTLLVVDRQQILRRAEMLGRVVAITPDDGNAQINRLPHRYRGRDFGSSRELRITIQIEPLRVSGADGQAPWDLE